MPIKLKQYVSLRFLYFFLNIAIAVFLNNANALVISCDETFDWNDPDKDGRISFMEIESMQKKAIEAKAQYIKNILDKLDTDNNGVLSINEYEVSYLRNHVQPHHIRADDDKDGLATCEQINIVRYGDDRKEKDCDYIEKFDGNGDGLLSYQEYAEAHKDKINENFKRYDVNDDTFVDLEEYIDTYWSPGPSLYERLTAMDVNNDEYVTFDEYCGKDGLSICKVYNERCKGVSELRCSTGFRANACRWVETDSDN